MSLAQWLRQRLGVAIGLGALLVACAASVGPRPAAAVSARHGMSIVVTTTTDELRPDGHCSLREALFAADYDRRVDSCPAGSGVDIIRVPAGRIVLRLGELAVHSSVRVIGAGTARTVIDGVGHKQALFGFHVLGGGRLTLAMLTITHMTTAIRNEGMLSMTSTTIRANADEFDAPWAGIDNVGSAFIAQSSFVNNLAVTIKNEAGATMRVTSSSFLGGLLDEEFYEVIDNDGALTLSSTKFVGCRGGLSVCTALAGGVVGNRGSLTASHVTFTGGCTYYGGWAITNDTPSATAFIDHTVVDDGVGGFGNAGTMYIATSTVRNVYLAGCFEPQPRHSAAPFSSTGGGGMVGNGDTGVLVMTGTTLSHNSEDFEGGFMNRGSALLVNDTIDDNTATDYDGSRDGAGGVDNFGSLLGINLTIVNNASQVGGSGGLVSRPGSVTELANSIVAGNWFSDIKPEKRADCTGTVASLGYNLVEETRQCTFGGVTTGLVLGTSPLLQPLADNGGPTWTALPLQGSPVIDAGDPHSLPSGTCPPVDQRNVVRPRDGNGDDARRCDIGATER